MYAALMYEARVRKATTELQRYESDLQAKEADVYRVQIAAADVREPSALVGSRWHTSLDAKLVIFRNTLHTSTVCIIGMTQGMLGRQWKATKRSQRCWLRTERALKRSTGWCCPAAGRFTLMHNFWWFCLCCADECSWMRQCVGDCGLQCTVEREESMYYQKLVHYIWNAGTTRNLEFTRFVILRFCFTKPGEEQIRDCHEILENQAVLLYMMLERLGFPPHRVE